VVETVPEMMELITNGEVDIYMDSMYPATLVREATGAQPILRRWRNVSEYHSVIFTRKDSGITLDDLPGHMVAMERSYSTSGFALPAAYLVDRGLKLVVKESFTDTVAVDEVGIYFSGDDKNTLFLILQGKVLIGATDDFFFDKSIEDALNWQPPVTLVNLAETGPVIRQAVLVRPNLGSDLKEAIKKELTNAHRDPEGRTALKMAANTCKFDDPPGVIEAAFEQMQAMHDKVEEIPGWQEAFEKGY
jgi:phosphonate transport system substrate-binding protein